MHKCRTDSRERISPPNDDRHPRRDHDRDDRRDASPAGQDLRHRPGEMGADPTHGHSRGDLAGSQGARACRDTMGGQRAAVATAGRLTSLARFCYTSRAAAAWMDTQAIPLASDQSSPAQADQSDMSRQQQVSSPARSFSPLRHLARDYQSEASDRMLLRTRIESHVTSQPASGILHECARWLSSEGTDARQRPASFGRRSSIGRAASL